MDVAQVLQRRSCSPNATTTKDAAVLNASIGQIARMEHGMEMHMHIHTCFATVKSRQVSNVNPSAVYRLNTFPLIHLNFIHMIVNAIALTPLLERFESEFGTLVTLALFTGRKQAIRKVDVESELTGD